MARPARLEASEDAGAAAEIGDVLGFLSLLWELDHDLRSASKRMAVDLGVTGPQRLVVRILGQHSGLSAGQIAQFLHLHPSTLTGVLERLERSGLVLRTVDASDARRHRFQLTNRGKRADSVHDGTVEASVRRALARLSAKDVEAARRVLRALAAEFK